MKTYDLKELSTATKKLDTTTFNTPYKTKLDELIRSTGQVSTIVASSSDLINYKVTASNVTQYSHGLLLLVLNNASVNKNNATLEVNSLGGKPVYYKNRQIVAGEFAYRSVSLFVYVTWAAFNSGNGAWIMIDDLNSTYAADNTSLQLTNGAFSVKDEGISTAKLANNSVTSAKISNGTIINEDIANTTITGGKLVDKTVTATQIADSTITATQLANNAVTTAKITDGNVTLAKLNSDVKDTTTGGTSGSTKLITSGATNAGLANKADKTNGVGQITDSQSNLYDALGVGYNALQKAINYAINAKFHQITDTFTTLLTNPGDVSGRVLFNKIGVFVICNLHFYYTSPSTARQDVYVCDIPSDYIPHDKYMDNANDPNFIIETAVADPTTTSSRSTHVKILNTTSLGAGSVSPIPKKRLFVSSAVTNETHNVRAQLVWTIS